MALENGTNTDEYGRTTTLASTVYADADGDGFPDAAVELEVTDGNGFEALWYIVLWDKATQQPVQIDDPFARTFRCGDVVDAVEPATVASPSPNTAPRATSPPAPTSRRSPSPAPSECATVGSPNWHPTRGTAASARMRSAPTATTHHRPICRIAPTQEAPAIGDQAQGAWLLLPPDNSKYSGIENWRLLGYSTTGTDETWYSACAWAPQ